MDAAKSVKPTAVHHHHGAVRTDWLTGQLVLLQLPAWSSLGQVSRGPGVADTRSLP